MLCCTVIPSIGNLYEGLGVINSTKINNQIGSYKAGQIIQDNTDTDDRITVLQYDCIIYLQAERQSSSKYIYQYPISDISEEIKEEYMQHIIDDKPSIIVSTKNIKVEELFYPQTYEFFVDEYELIGTAEEFEIYKFIKE